MDKDIHYLSLSGAANLIKSGKLSPVELTRACLERIEYLNLRIHAFITVLADSAIGAAIRAEREIREGGNRGPLHGIPIAHKDILWTKGIRTTAHSRLLEYWIPQKNATIVERLETSLCSTCSP